MNAEKNIKLWSTLGMRASFGLIALELANIHSDLIITTSDVSTSAGLDRYKQKYPDRYVDVGIAEQNLIGISAGLSSEGFKVISTTFAPFQTLRCCEQIKVNLGYMKNKICMVGLASGLVLGTLGFTHCSIEDIGVLRSIPNIAIVVPSDPFELFKLLHESINYKNSVYIRLTAGANTKIINNKDYDFAIGKAVEILPGEDVAIIGCGNIQIILVTMWLLPMSLGVTQLTIQHFTLLMLRPWNKLRNTKVRLKPNNMEHSLHPLLRSGIMQCWWLKMQTLVGL